LLGDIQMDGITLTGGLAQLKGMKELIEKETGITVHVAKNPADSVVAGCFIGPYLWGLFSKRVTKLAVALGMGLSFAAIAVPTIVISLTSGFKSAIAVAPELGVISMAVSAVSVPVISLFTKNSEKESERIDSIFKPEKEND
ncbi:MAG: rod shape-determining protein, partial [Clostridia bacterium]|nr:rod shape-determining protein [Clostridia bacterium]